MPAPVIASAIPAVAGLAGQALGGGGKTEAVVPDDMQGMRSQQMGLLNYLLGMGPDPRSFNPQQMQATAQQKYAQAAAQGGGALKDFINSHPDTMALLSGQTPTNVPGTQTPWGFAQQQWGGLPGNGPQMPQQPSFNPGSLPLFGQGGAQVQPGMGPAGGTNMVHDMAYLGGPQGVPGMTPNVNLQPGGTGGGQVPQQGGGAMTPQQRLESFFGPLGINPSTLQQQAGNAYERMLQQPTPEQRSTEIALPQLQQNLAGNAQTQQATNALMGLQTGAGADVEGRLSQIGDRPITGSSQLDQVLQQLASGQGGGINFGPSGLGIAQLQQLASSNPGQGVVNALDPSYQRNLASANQAGGRFGSANAVLRSRALDDYNLAAQNALQRGVDQQTTAAQALGQLGLGGDSLRLQGLLGGQQGQLSALGLALQGAQGRDQSALQALGQLGGFRLQGQGQQASNLQAAGNLGLGQGQLGNQAAGVLGQLFGQQGQAERGLVNNAFGAGTVNTQQDNVGNQRAIDLLLQQLGTAQQATLGGPVQQTPSGFQQGADLGGQAAQMYLLSQYLGGKQG